MYCQWSSYQEFSSIFRVQARIRARKVIDRWIRYYNHSLCPSALENRSPVDYLKEKGPHCYKKYWRKLPSN